MMWRMLGAPHPMYAHRADSRGILERGRSADTREGVESFLEKRAAVQKERGDEAPRPTPEIVERYATPSRQFSCQ